MIKKIAWLCLCATLVSGCGGGGSTVASGVGSGGTGSYTSGPVTGLGSIIVNGIRYDVTSAGISDDEDSTGLDESSLKLGMFVDVDGSEVTAASTGQTATATSVRLASDFIGQISAVAPSSSAPTSISLFGRTISIDSKTVYTAPINVGDYVVVYGLVSPAGYVATRIEKLNATPAVQKMSGVVRHLDDIPNTFTLGSQTINYSLVSPLPTRVRNGSLVRVWVSPVQVGGIWTATKLRAPVASVRDSKSATVKGLIGTLTDQTSFVVNGINVDASKVTLSGVLAEGSRIEVKGKMVNGVLAATQVTTETQADIANEEVELHGRAYSVTSSQLTVRGVVVSYTPSVLLDGPVTALQCIEVKGTVYNAQNQLIATEIKSDTGCKL
ncbi:MAG: hypothetical protein KGI91_15325 [Burkholderiales bacterium]|nr:hypothetical protein [Burkholderiales bacterium]MDE2078420.1 hypothetical protein [Burkholderiales bacterium]MDE2434224.1 hypothetical protein [Burkholderiales bacterium]